MLFENGVTMENWQEKIRQLELNNLSVQVEKNKEIIFQSSAPMLRPLFDCLNEKKIEMHGATVIDKIVGLAAAYLCVLGNVSKVVTPVASESAKKMLAQHKIDLFASKVISEIRNHENTDQCPMEKLALSCRSPQEFYEKLAEKYF